MSEERQDQLDGRAPIIVSPGEEGWPQEPKVTDAERLLYGDMAGVVRLLGQATVAARDAYSLACKRVGEAYSETAEREYVPTAQETWETYARALATHRSVAARATAQMEDIVVANERAMSAPALA